MNFKNILRHLLQPAFALCLIAQTLSAADINDLTYTQTDKNVTIIDCNATASGALVIPDTINEKPVIGIGSDAFAGCSGLTSVTIPSSVYSIGNRAFKSCSGLTSVTIPSGVTSIGEETFIGCSSLTSVALPDSVTSIGDYAFYICSGLTSVTIPGSPGNFAFFGCTGLTSVTFANSVYSIGNNAFSYCTSLTSVTIPSSVTSIGDGGFRNCSGLTSATFLGNAPTMGTGVFDNVASGFTVYYIDGKTGFDAIGYPTGYYGGEITIEQPLGTNLSDGGSRQFGSVPVGSGASRTFTIKNLGSMPLTGLTISKNGANAANFTVTGNPVAPVAAGGSTTFTVKFSPSSIGAKTAAIHIATNDANESPFDINLTGTGLAPRIVVQQPVNTTIPDRGIKDYRNVLIGSSKSLTFTIKNTGYANLTGIAITKNGTYAADFKVTIAPAASVVPGGSTTFVLKFTPGATGIRIAAIHIASSDSTKNPYDITVVGTGTAPRIVVQQPVGSSISDGGARAYAKVPVGSSTSLTFTIKNTGTAKLTGISITKGGANAPDFKVTTAPASSVAPGGSTKFVLKFTPGATGSRSAVIHIASSDKARSPFDIIVSGTGTAVDALQSASSMAMASGWLAPSTTSVSDPGKAIATVDPVDGMKYNTLAVTKDPGTAVQRRIVEVSSNLVDWYSGTNHTTVLRNDATILIVRDSTPLSSGTKRYIRLRTANP